MRGLSCLLWPWVALGGLGGCAQLAGIDKTNGDERQVTLTYDRLSIGAKVATAPLALDGLTATYLVPDDTNASVLVPEPAEAVTSGEWAAKIKTGTPPVLFTLPDGATYLWALPSRTMHGAFAALEHPGVIAPPPGASVTVNAVLDAPVAAGDSFEFLEVGTWVRAALTMPALAETALAQSFPYLSTAAMTSDDVVLVSRYSGGALAAVGEIVPAGPQAVATTIAATLAPVAHDQMIAMPLDAAGIAARLTGEKPAETTAAGLSWSITAAPAFAQGVTVGPLLASGAVAPTATTLGATFGNPFAATHMWSSLLAFSAARSRTYAPAGAMGPSIGLVTALGEVTVPDATTPIAAAVALPLVITVGITPLVADGTSVLIDATKPVPVSFTTDGMPASLFEMELVELVPNGATFTQKRLLVLASDTPSWQIPASFLAPAHRYFFRAITISGGYGDVATGDLSTVTTPYAMGSHDGGVFTVTL